jgi:hypothetical protein
MKGDLFSTTEKRAVQFGENIWFSQLLMETVGNMMKCQSEYDEAIKTQDSKSIQAAKLQLDSIVASLKLAAHFYDDAPEGQPGD